MAKYQQESNIEQLAAAAKPGDEWMTVAGEEITIRGIDHTHLSMAGNLRSSSGIFQWDFSGRCISRYGIGDLAGPKALVETQTPQSTTTQQATIPIINGSAYSPSTTKLWDLYKSLGSYTPSWPRRHISPNADGSHNLVYCTTHVAIDNGTRVSECRTCRTRMEFIDWNWVAKDKVRA